MSRTSVKSSTVFFQGFTDNTTCHGIPYVGRAKSLIKRMLWGVLFVCVTACLVINLTIITRDFLSYEVVVNIDLQQHNNLDFPAVTVCNMNPVRRSAIESSDIFQEALASEVAKKKRRKRNAHEDCEAGWQSYGSSCYLFKSTSGDRKSATNAATDCASYGAYLVSINDEAENDYITSVVSSTSSTHWIGLSGTRWTSYFWLDGSSSTWESWDNCCYIAGDCVHFSLSATPEMISDHCTNTYFFVCRKDTLPCEDPWFDSSAVCFYVSNVAKSHTNADIECQSMGGRLASFDSEAQADAVVDTSSAYYWIGRRRQCVWADGTELEEGNFHDWGSNEMASASTCIRTTGKWRTGDNSRRYICEKSAVEITTTESITTEEPTTEETTTPVATTETQTTQEPTTEGATTPVPTTETQTTAELKTEGPTTPVPTTEGQTTPESTTEGPTPAPTTEGQTTPVPTTEGQTTPEPATEGPTTPAPTTEGPTTSLLTTEGPTTPVPTTEGQTTPESTTEGPTTPAPTTEGQITPVPTTEGQTTPEPATEGPTTSLLTTEGPTTPVPTTEGQTTPESTTEGPTTPAPTTEGPTTPVLTTEGPTTPVPTTEGQTTPESTTGGPITPVSTTEKQTTEGGTTQTATRGQSTQIPTKSKPVVTTRDHASNFPSWEYCDSCITSCQTQEPDTSTKKLWTSPLFSTSTASPPTTLSTEPQPVEGSKFPDRLQTREEFQAETTVTEILSEIDLEEKRKLGYSPQEFILDCQYAGHDCFVRDFAEFYNAVHGNCFIFNSGWNSSQEILKSQRTGRRYGLHLILNIQQEEYIDQTGDTAGVRLVVHSRSRMPFPEDEGISVSPGHVTAIGLRKMMVERLGEPYGDCMKPRSSAENDVYSEIYPVLYSTTACQKTCYQKHVIHQCQCADANYPLTGQTFGDVNVSACRTSNVEEGDCIYEVERKFRSNILECNCPTSCTDTVYDMELSEAQWPGDVRKEEFLDNMADKIPLLLDDPSDPDKYQRNLVKVEVFYEEFNYQLISETPRYPVWNYLSDCGGVLGLWLGCSVLTIFEFFELLVDLMIFKLCRFLGYGPGLRPS